MEINYVNIRIEPQIKSQAEIILKDLGLNHSKAINLFYKELIYQKKLPFEPITEDDFQKIEQRENSFKNWLKVQPQKNNPKNFYSESLIYSWLSNFRGQRLLKFQQESGFKVSKYRLVNYSNEDLEELKTIQIEFKNFYQNKKQHFQEVLNFYIKFLETQKSINVSKN